MFTFIGIQYVLGQNCAPSFTHIQKQKEVRFTNTSSPVTGLEQFYWSFGDNSPLQKIKQGTPTEHTYPNAGTYIVTLFDSTCPTLKRGSDTVIVSNTKVFQPLFTCTDLGNGEFAFYDGSTPAAQITSRNWDFGDGHSDKTSNPVYSYTQNGAYRVCLYIGDNINNFDYTCDTIRVTNALNCKAGFITQYVNNQFEFYNYSFSSDPTITYQWQFGDGQTSTEIHPTHKYTGSGNYNVTLRMQSNTCNDSVTNSIDVPDTTICNLTLTKLINNQRVQFILYDKTTLPLPEYYIEFGDGQSETITNNITEHIYNGIGIYKVFVTTVGSSCPIELTVRDSVVVSSEIAICKANIEIVAKSFAVSVYNSSYVYGSQRSSSVTIDWGDGITYTGIDSVNFFHTYTAQGLYPISLTISNPGGCSDSITKVIGVGPTYTLSGSVTAGNLPVAFTTIKIYAYEPFTGTLNSYSYLSTNYDGTYSIDLPKGYYLIQADFPFTPSSTSSYLPTYYRNKLHWDGGDVILLNTNRSNIDIGLIPFNYIANGNGSISGKTIYALGVGNENGQIPPGAPVNKALVFLINAQGETIAYTHSNAEGKFDFDKLPLGTYKVWAEMAGKVTVPAMVNLTETKSAIGDIAIVVGKYSVSTAVETKAVEQNKFSIYPNPANQQLTLTSNTSRINMVEIYNQHGKLVLSADAKSTAEFQLDITQLLSGFYYIHIIHGNGLVDNIKFLKTTD